MWRPEEGWTNPFHKTGDYGQGVASWNEQPEFSAFEQGADTLLEALKAEGIDYDGIHPLDSFKRLAEYLNRVAINKQGKVIFIPDVETTEEGQ